MESISREAADYALLQKNVHKMQNPPAQSPRIPQKVGEENEKVLNELSFVLVTISYLQIMKKKSEKLLRLYEVIEKMYEDKDFCQKS